MAACIEEEGENGQTYRPLMAVPKVKILEVLKVQNKGPRGRHLRITKTLEKLKQRFYWTGCRQSAIVRIVKYAK